MATLTAFISCYADHDYGHTGDSLAQPHLAHESRKRDPPRPGRCRWFKASMQFEPRVYDNFGMRVCLILDPCSHRKQQGLKLNTLNTSRTRSVVAFATLALNLHRIIYQYVVNVSISQIEASTKESSN